MSHASDEKRSVARRSPSPPQPQARLCPVLLSWQATRSIFEVIIESLPQSVLQAYIYVVVIKHCGVAAPPGAACLDRYNAMWDSLATLPKSILISTLATLKTWVELVFAARAAGLTVLAKGLQLWNVGAGLPLDALKKGAHSFSTQ